MKRRALFKVDFDGFYLFIWSTKEKIIEDMYELYDEQGAKLLGETGSGGFKSIDFLCYDFEILEVGSDKTRG